MSRECLYDPFKLEPRLTRVYRRHGRNSCGPSDENANGLGTAPQWKIFEMKLRVSISFVGLMAANFLDCGIRRTYLLAASSLRLTFFILMIMALDTLGKICRVCLFVAVACE